MPGVFPIGPLYGAQGCKMGEIASQVEAGDLPALGTASAACRLSARCAL